MKILRVLPDTRLVGANDVRGAGIIIPATIQEIESIPTRIEGCAPTIVVYCVKDTLYIGIATGRGAVAVDCRASTGRNNSRSLVLVVVDCAHQDEKAL